MKYLRWIYNAVRPLRGALMAMMTCHLLLVFCSITFIYASKKAVDVAVVMFRGEAGSEDLIVWGAVMVAVVLLRIGLNALRTYVQTKTDISLKNRLRSRLFDILLHSQVDGGSKFHSGDILNRIQEDVRVVSNICSSALPSIFGTLLQFAAALAFLTYLEPMLGLVVLVVGPIGLLAGKYVSGRIRKLTLDIRRSDSMLQSHLQESIQHVTLLQTLEYTDSSADSLTSLQTDLYTNEIRRVRFSVLSRMIISFGFQAAHLTAFLWGVFGIAHGTVTYGMMTAFLQLVGQIQRPLLDLSAQIPAVIHATASIDRLMDIEAMPQEPVEEPVFLDGTVGIRFEDVSFAFSDSDRKILDRFSYDFTPGSRTAVVGPTGIGKTTMIRLLLSLLKPQDGEVSIYNSITSVSAKPATRCNLVYVPQGNSLFSGTVRDNLLMGNPEASEQQMEAALYVAAAEFVFDLPGGLDAQCFEAGGGLSEGQAQRIAIARALLRPGSLLLLDEFSSALDAETESVLMERLTSQHPDHTMIFITHRDKIIDYCTDVLRLS